MTKFNVRTAALGLLWVVSCVLWMAPEGAHAEEAREAVLALSVSPDLVAPVALQGALEAELGVGVQLSEQPDFSAPTLQISRLGSGNVEGRGSSATEQLVEVALSSRSLPRSTRQLVLQDGIEAERVETLALIAANLVRNEAAALLPDLRPAKVSSVDVATPAPQPEPKPAARAEGDPCALTERGSFGFDFAPGVGSSSSPEGRKAPRRVSLGVIGTLHGALHGFELSIGVNIARGPVCGAQFALANVALGPVSGLQMGEFNLSRGDLRGAQLGLLNLSTGGARGLQAAVANGAGGTVHGAQLGVVNYAGGRTEGLAGSVLNIGAGHVHGAQLGVGNVAAADGLYGVQAGVANVAVGGVRGTQLGVANVNVGDLSGAQLGVANVNTGNADVQIGVFNYADRSKASIGLLSIVRHGRTSIDLTGAVESGLLIAGVTHGGKYWHNTYGVGLRTDKQGQRPAVQFGFGVRVLELGRVQVDIDAIHTHLLRDGSKDSFIAGGRVPVTIKLVRGFGVMVAPSYQVMVTDDSGENPDPVFGRSVFRKGSQPDDTRVIGYPGLTLGLRYEFDHGA